MKTIEERVEALERRETPGGCLLFFVLWAACFVAILHFMAPALGFTEALRLALKAWLLR